MDIDDDDEDEVIDMPNRVVSDKTMFEHHIIVEIKAIHMRIAPNKWRSEKNLKYGKLTYDVMNDVYDTIDSYMDNTLTVSDYRINIKMWFMKDCHEWQSRVDVEPPYDSDEDYGTEGDFKPEQEVIHNIRFEIDFDSKRMNFEQRNGIVHFVTDIILGI